MIVSLLVLLLTTLAGQDASTVDRGTLGYEAFRFLELLGAKVELERHRTIAPVLSETVMPTRQPTILTPPVVNGTTPGQSNAEATTSGSSNHTIWMVVEVGLILAGTCLICSMGCVICPACLKFLRPGPNWPVATEQLLPLEFAGPDWPEMSTHNIDHIIEENRFKKEDGCPYGTPRKSPAKDDPDLLAGIEESPDLDIGDFDNGAVVVVEENKQPPPVEQKIEERMIEEKPASVLSHKTFSESRADRMSQLDSLAMEDLPVVPENSAGTWRRNGSLLIEKDSM